MSLPFSLFLALKYLRPKRTFVSVVTIISVLGVLLGVAVLIIVISVMNGFDDMWREKILSFNAHVTVSGEPSIDDPDPVITQIKAVPDVTGAAPFVQGLVFIQRGSRVYTPLMRGIDMRYEKDVSRIPDHIARGAFDVEDGGLVAGGDLVRQMRVRVGEKILVHSPQRFSRTDEVFLPEELPLKGVFELGMWEYDIGYILTSLDKARDLFQMEQGVHGIQVMTRDPFVARAVADRIAEKLGPGFSVTTWMEQNRQLFAALRVEKNMMFVLLLVITLVASFCILCTLIVMVVQKTREIGLLKSLGFSDAQIVGVFLWQGGISGVLGVIGGNLFAFLFLHYRNNVMDFLARVFGLELLPKELYHLSELPASIVWSEVLLIDAIALLICTAAGILPAIRAATLDPVRALRHE